MPGATAGQRPRPLTPAEYIDQVRWGRKGPFVLTAQAQLCERRQRLEKYAVNRRDAVCHLERALPPSPPEALQREEQLRALRASNTDSRLDTLRRLLAAGAGELILPNGRHGDIREPIPVRPDATTRRD